MQYYSNPFSCSEVAVTMSYFCCQIKVEIEIGDDQAFGNSTVERRLKRFLIDKHLFVKPHPCLHLCGRSPRAMPADKGGAR